jgi:hypothetical protein
MFVMASASMGNGQFDFERLGGPPEEPASRVLGYRCVRASPSESREWQGGGVLDIGSGRAAII